MPSPEFKIGMALNKIAMSLDDNNFRKIKEYLTEIEDNVIILSNRIQNSDSTKEKES